MTVRKGIRGIALIAVFFALTGRFGWAEKELRAGSGLESKGKAQAGLLKQEWERDPFSAPEKNVQQSGGTAQLAGIFLRNGKKLAIINRSFVKEGDTVQGMLVTRIEDNQVLLTRDGKEFYLRIAENEKNSKVKPQ